LTAAVHLVAFIHATEALQQELQLSTQQVMDVGTVVTGALVQA
jgi:hypothetical protein